MHKQIHTQNYPIYIGSISHENLGLFLKNNYKNKQLFIILDENTLKYCYPQIASIINECGPIELIEIESGEQNKNIEICKGIWEALTQLKADRHALIINLGGGVICDMGAFVASTYKRGIDYINIATTLLAQADASVGGKTGIDFNGIKNQIGLFSFPKAVFVDPGFLKTLDKKQLLSGFAEIIKHALIADINLWNKIKDQEPDKHFYNEDILCHAIDIKNKIVNDDPYENNKRKMLNFGHTIGHALETFGFENPEKFLLHGEAVALGMMAETFISFKKNKIDENLHNQICRYIKKYYKSFDYDKTDFQRIIELMKNDKKNKDNKINFTLLSGKGNATIDNYIEIPLIYDALNFLMKQ